MRKEARNNSIIFAGLGISLVLNIILGSWLALLLLQEPEGRDVELLVTHMSQASKSRELKKQTEPPLPESPYESSTVKTMPTPSYALPTETVAVSLPTISGSFSSASPSLPSDDRQPPLLSKMLQKYNHIFSDLPGGQLLMLVSEKGGNRLYSYAKDSSGLWELALDSIPAIVGKNGLSDNKEEGDLCTPTGLYELGSAFGNEKKPNIAWPYRSVTENSYWVDDPNSKFYNEWVEGTEQKDWKSAEHLIEVKTAYAYAVVINYNMDPIVPGKGSAIFLHCGKNPTAGCISVSRNNMLTILKWLDANAQPKILIAQQN